MFVFCFVLGIVGLGVFFNVYVEADYLDPTTNMLTVDQGGLTLPSRDYYFGTNNASAVARAAENTCKQENRREAKKQK